jgi:hypothetical protein
VKSRIAAGNRCFYSLGQIFKSGAMSKAVNIKIYKTIMKPVVEQGMWRTRTNEELWEL